MKDSSAAPQNDDQKKPISIRLWTIILLTLLALYIKGNRQITRQWCYTMMCYVLPFNAEHKLKVEAILTNNGPEFCGTPNHPFVMFLELNEIEHRRIKVRTPRTNGFLERVNRTVLEEFFQTAFRKKYYKSLEALQANLDA